MSRVMKESRRGVRHQVFYLRVVVIRTLFTKGIIVITIARRCTVESVKRKIMYASLGSAALVGLPHVVGSRRD
jgi:hypothetical protein